MGYNNIQPDKLRYFLTTSTVTDELLEFSPDEWQDSSITIKRDFANFMGNKREYSLPLGFVKRAREILKTEYLLNGVMGTGIIRIEVLDNSTWSYRPLYQGKIDFMKTDLDRNYIEVNFLDSDLQAAKEAYEKTQFTMGMGIAPTQAVLPPVKFTESATYFIAGVSYFNFFVIQPWTCVTPATNLNEKKVRLGGVSFQDQTTTFKDENIQDFNLNDPLFTVNKTGLNINLTFNLLFDVHIGGAVDPYGHVLYLGWKRVDPETSVVTSGEHLLYDFRQWGIGVHEDKRINLAVDNIPLVEGGVYFLYTKPESVSGSDLCAIRYKEGNLKFNFIDVAPEDRVDSQSPFGMFQNLFRQISGIPTLTVQSNFLQSIPYLRITSGDCIRHFSRPPSILPTISTSFADFFKTFDCLFGLGFDIINGIPTIEPKEYFLDENLEIADLGEVSNVQIKTDPDFIFNDIRAGYEKQDYEENWGKEEVNNSQTWKTPVSAGKKTLDLISPFRADAYGINEVRSKYILGLVNNETNSDGTEDNDVFLVWCDPDSFVPGYTYEDDSYLPPITFIIRDSWSALTIDQATSYSGIEDNPYYFNWLITPKRNLLRNGRRISSAMYGQVNQSKVLTMSGLDKWRNLTVTYDGETFNEGTDINISDLPSPLVDPFLITLEAAFPLDFYDRYIQDPRGYVTFWVGGDPYRMFIKDISFDIVNRSEFEIQGVPLPGQDLTKLIS